MTNQERYTVIEGIYNNNGVMQVDVAVGGGLSSLGIPITDGAQLFLILLSVAAGMNDVDSGLYAKMVAKFTALTTSLPTTLWIDLKGANSNTNPSADAALFYVKNETYTPPGGDPQPYMINSQVADLLTNNTGLTRVTSTDDLFPFLVQYRDELMFDVLAGIYPDNYIMYHEPTDEFIIVEVV